MQSSCEPLIIKKEIGLSSINLASHGFHLLKSLAKAEFSKMYRAELASSTKYKTA